MPEGATREQIDALRRELGFDRPILVQYLDYPGRPRALRSRPVGGAARPGLSTSSPSRLPYTLRLAGGALLVACGIGIPVGIVMAVWRGSWLERVLARARAGRRRACRPSGRGILLILLFAVHAAAGCRPRAPASSASLIMPSIALGALSMATFARMTRIAVLDELSQGLCPRGARARRSRSAPWSLRHVLRNAAIPVITIAALEIGNLLAGAVIVETVFAWPGIGQLAVQSILARDFLSCRAIVLLISFVYVAINLLADLLYSVRRPAHPAGALTR